MFTRDLPLCGQTDTNENATSLVGGKKAPDKPTFKTVKVIGKRSLLNYISQVQGLIDKITDTILK